MLCLTVCVVPALAGNDQYTDGFFYWSNAGSVNLTVGSQTVNVLNGYFPATISADSSVSNFINNSYRNFTVNGRPFVFDNSGFASYDNSQMYVEVLFSVPAPLTVNVAGLTSSLDASCMGYISLMYLEDGVLSNGGVTVYASSIDSVYDDLYVPCTYGDRFNSIVVKGNYDIKRYFGYRYYFDHASGLSSVKCSSWAIALSSNFNGVLTFSDPDYLQGIFDEVTVNTGILQEINGSLTDIKTSTAIIQGDLAEIKDGLQDSNSSIWGAFKDSLSGLLVPSAEDLTGVKDGFDQLAQDKLGGAYQTVDMVSGGVQSVIDKFKDPGSSPGVEFPGISVPLGGDVGTVTLAASQIVTIPEKMTEVLYPVAGIIIPIVCTIWTVRLGLDMVHCFMSGMSYGDFLHRHTDEEDNEV